MDRELRRIVESKLEQASLSAEAGLMVLAALDGAQELAQLLTSSELLSDTSPTQSLAEPSKPPRTYLSSISVQGFRGIGPRSTIQLESGPGLTLVVGRNGSGKSSFAEGLEMLLTGENRRWSDRSAIWKEGWRNLHHGTEVSIEATFQVEGHPGPTVVSRTWAADDDLERCAAFAQHHGEPRTGLDALGWTDALAAYRPFLSYNELGSMLDEGPAKLYDALSAILGLEDLVAAQEVLRQERLSRAKAMKDLLNERDTMLLPALEDLEDSRAAPVRVALLAKPIDIDALASASASSPNMDSVDSGLGVLAKLAALEAPDLEEVAEVASDLRNAATAMDRVAGTDSALASDMLELLTDAVEFRREHDQANCPVCEVGTLDDEWSARAQARTAKLERTAADAKQAGQMVDAAIDRLGQTLLPAPAVLAEAATVGLDSGHVDAVWARLLGGLSPELMPLASHIETEATELAEQVEQLVAAAKQEYARREDSWRPIATKIAAFTDKATGVLSGEVHLKDIKRAEGWLKDALADIRNERFAPISEQSTTIWETLGSQSNVELAHVVLAGSLTKRRVEIDVRIDGEGGAALGVMSQGELHALALSLFLPRATLPESPFGMVVIDDPVQAMDPVRVDGLAQVLRDVAQVRQVVVFTHDDRLPESIRRLGIDAHIVEVVRRENSVVELREALDPVSRYLDDARALSHTDDLPEEIATRVVPGFCRLALEATCSEVTRRRRISRGEAHADVENSLLEARKLSQRMALALFDDPDRSGDVLQRLNQINANAADTYKECNRGAHEPSPGLALRDLVRDAEGLVQHLRELG